LGLGVYGYLLLAAAGGGPVNWGAPRTLADLWWLASGRLYAALFFGLAPMDLLARLSAWGQMALSQLGGGPWGAALALLGLWWTDRRHHAWWRVTGLLALAFTIYSLAYRTADSHIYLIPVWAMAALWLAAGLAWISALPRRPWLSWSFAVVALLLLPAAAVQRSWHANDLSRDHQARDFVAAVLAEAEPGAVILTAADGPTFALWYARYGLGQRSDIIPLNINLYDFEWYRLGLHVQHPDLAPTADLCSTAPELERLLQEIMAVRPLYRAEPLSLALPDTLETPAGLLVRIRPTYE
jgi:hypothetical protein